jgi:CRISPR-associated protein Cmr1
MYGGGARVGVNDRDFPIRPSSIRGQLRFWWRATRGARINTAEDLFNEEKRIWGSVDEPSSTVITVEAWSWNGVRAVDDNNYGGLQKYQGEAYALFSAKQNNHDIVKEGAKFTLKISFDNGFADDISCALWAWVNFGGLGARTRRGLGALYCEDMAPAKADVPSVRTWFQAKIKEFGLIQGTGHKWPTREWSTLWKELIIGKPCGNALQAWGNSVGPLKDFRQRPGFARHEGEPRHPGRSFWPEPDTLRRSLGTHCTRTGHVHAPNPAMPDGLPRAALGLPIIFQFKGYQGDPECALYPNGKNRRASPFMLRPLKAKDGQCGPMSLLLDTPGLGFLGEDVLEIKDRPGTFVYGDVEHRRLAAYPNAPMRGRSTGGSAVEAFCNYLIHDIDFKRIP